MDVHPADVIGVLVPHENHAVVEVKQPLIIDGNEGLCHDSDGQPGEVLGHRCL